MRLVFGAPEVHHAVETGKGCAATLVAVAVELLLCEDVAAVLRVLVRVSVREKWEYICTSHEKDTIFATCGVLCCGDVLV